MDGYGSLPPKARKLVDDVAKRANALDNTDFVVDDQRWLIRDLVSALIDMGVSTSTISETIFERCEINDPELVRSIHFFLSR